MLGTPCIDYTKIIISRAQNSDLCAHSTLMATKCKFGAQNAMFCPEKLIHCLVVATKCKLMQ